MNDINKKIKNHKKDDCCLNRNIQLEYIYNFLRNFDISSAVWVLYMLYKGLSLWQIGIVEGIFHAASVLFEVPSGAAADLLGRKKVMICGRICALLSSVILMFSNSLLWFCIGFVLSALGYNLNSGSEEALVYDTLKCLGKEKTYIKINSRLNVYIEIAGGLATFIGGILAEKSFILCYGAVIIVTVLSLLPAVFMTEPDITEEYNGTGGNTENQNGDLSAHENNIRKILTDSIKITKGTPEVRYILMFYPVLSAFYAVIFYYGQGYLAQFGLNKIHISTVMLFAGIIACIGSMLSERLLCKLGKKIKRITALLMGTGLIAVALGNVYIVILTFLMISFINALLYPIESSSLNALIPSGQRATIISIDSICYSAAMIMIFPITGLIGDTVGLHCSFLLLGVFEIIYTAVILKKENIPEMKKK